MTPLELHRDPIGSGVHVHRLPAWLPPQRGTYWHQPRSASLRANGTILAILWCGQYRYVAAAGLVAPEPPAELRCGTCAGRSAGYRQEDGLIFQPRDHWQLPKACPCSDPDPSDWRRCAACGRPTNAARGWNAYGLARHAPDPALAERWEPCSRHGWTEMVWRQGQLVCGSWGCR